jgi:WD40 repeat protein
MRNQLAFSPDGRSLAVLAPTGQLIVIDTLSGEFHPVALPTATYPTSGMIFTNEGRAVAFSALEQPFRLYDSATGQPLSRLEVPSVGAVLSTPDGNTLYAVRSDESSGSTEILRWSADLSPLPSFGKHKGGWIAAVAVSPRGNWFAAGGGKHARVWNLNGKEPPARATCHLKAGGYVKSVAITADGSMLAAAVRNRVIVWDVKSGKEVARYSNHKRAVNALAMHPERPVLVSGGNEELVFVYDLGSRQKPKALDWKIGPIGTLAFAPDGLRCAAAGYSGKVVVWDVDE